MKGIAIFGAGNYGRRALEYFGEENVCCFVDNNPEKKGSVIKGKEVISFEDFKKNATDYRIVIATARSSEIKKQLGEMDFNNYICYTPAYEHFIESMKRCLQERKYNSIVLYGIDQDTFQIVEVLKTLGLGDAIMYAVRSPYVEKEAGLHIDGIEIKDALEDMSQTMECFVVSSSCNHIALEAELRQRFGKGSIIDPYKQVAYYDTDEIVFNPYLSKTSETSEKEWNDDLMRDMTKQSVRAYVDVVKRQIPLFRYIEIETINRCNGVCSFCPVNKLIDPRPLSKMSRDLFEKIINELSDMNYNGELSLFSNNEPLLDDRIVELHRYTRVKLPHARIHMFTNGMLFTLPVFIDLMKYLDELVIDNYQQELKMIKPVEEIKNYVDKHPELRRKVTIVLRKREEILTSRGGDAPNRTEKISFAEETCALPFEQMIIRPDGKVSLCCNDPLGKNTLGDVSKESLRDVWYGETYQDVRQRIAEGRGNWEHCRYCDTFYLY